MRKLAAGFTCSAIVLLIVSLPAIVSAQEGPSPETRELDVWVGDWSYTLGDGIGSMHFEWFGNYMVRAEEKTPAGWDVVHFMAWDPNAEAYVWHRYWSSGYMDEAQGWVEDGTWTFLFLDRPERVRKMTMTMESPEEIRFQWEESREGGLWEVTGQGRTTRVR